MEEWRPITVNPDYEVSSEGRLRRVTRRTRATPGTIIKPTPNASGYPSIKLRYPGSTKRTNVLVHRLVAFAFLPTDHPHHGQNVNHLNFDRTDNRASNLEWCSVADNIRYSAKAGRMAPPRHYGLANIRGKMTDEDVAEVRRLRGEGASVASLMARFGVSESQIRGILKGERRSRPAPEASGKLAEPG